MKLIIEIDGYYEQVLLSGESCTLTQLRQMYRQVKRQAATVFDVPRLFAMQYGFMQLPYDASIQVAFVIDTDTNRIYTPTY